MLPIDLHNKLKEEEDLKKELAEAQAALAKQSGLVPCAIPEGKSQFMTMVPCIIVHPGVIADSQIRTAVKEILDSMDVAEVASPHILSGATIVPLIPEINRETRELSFAVTVSAKLPAHVTDEQIAGLNPALIAKEIMAAMMKHEAANQTGIGMQILFPTLSPTPPNSVDPFEQ